MDKTEFRPGMELDDGVEPTDEEIKEAEREAEQEAQ